MTMLDQIMNGRDGETELRAKFQATTKPTITEPARSSWTGNKCIIKRDDVASEPYYDPKTGMYYVEASI